MLTPNTLLQNRYLIVRRLGEGGMGAVYEATDQRFDSTVAIKEMLVSAPELQKAFEREARLLNTLRHAALPVVMDYFAERDGHFLVMQYIPGEDLARLLAQRGGPFPVEQVLVWADQLLGALEYLHSRTPPIIHRDIKPQNLKLTPDGDVVLLDFGLAKGSAGQMTLATASVYGYTPSFAPLEQMRGEGSDARSDLYSLAATLYYLMTGVPPADAVGRAEAHVNNRPDPLRPAAEVNPAVGRGVSDVLGWALSLSRDARPASVSAMRAALRAQAPQSGTAPFASPLFVAAAVPEPSAWRPASASSRAPAPRESRSGVLVALAAATVLVLICAGIVAVVVAINLSQPREVAPKNAPPPPPQRPPVPVPEPPPAPEMPGSYSPPEPVQRVSGGVLAGKAIERPQPVYPQMARAAGIEGAVVVEVTVGEKGDVIAAHAVSGHPLLRDAAVQAARGWRFTPTVLSGKPVKVIGTITFNFRRP